MNIQENIDRFMSEGLRPESVTIPTKDAAEFITELSKQFPEQKFFIVNKGAETRIERKVG